MKNTLENKAKFFAQYFGQKVIPQDCDKDLFRLTEISLLDDEIGIWGDWSGGTNPEKSCNDVLSINDAYLELKPLSSISDEDIKALGYRGTIKGFLMVWENNLTPYMVDYLRSKGYALPWNGITVEEQIEFGWIKLEK